MKEKVLVFNSKLLSEFPRNALIDTTELLPQLLQEAVFIDREEAEVDFTHKQFIVYSIFRYERNIFRYQRSSKGSETRLRGQYSIGVGGHVNENDDLPIYSSLYTKLSLIEEARNREIAEEFFIQGLPEPRMIGLLNDDSNDVGRVHLGIVYEYHLTTPNVEAREKKFHLNYGFVPIRDLVSDIDEYESWSQIIITDYLT